MFISFPLKKGVDTYYYFYYESISANKVIIYIIENKCRKFLLCMTQSLSEQHRLYLCKLGKMYFVYEFIKIKYNKNDGGHNWCPIDRKGLRATFILFYDKKMEINVEWRVMNNVAGTEWQHGGSWLQRHKVRPRCLPHVYHSILWYLHHLYHPKRFQNRFVLSVKSKLLYDFKKSSTYCYHDR